MKIFVLFMMLNLGLNAAEKYVVLQGNHVSHHNDNRGGIYKVEAYIMSYPFKVDLEKHSKEALIKYFIQEKSIDVRYKRDANGEFKHDLEGIIMVFDSMEELKKKIKYPSSEFNYRVSRSKFKKFEKEFLKNKK